MAKETKKAIRDEAVIKRVKKMRVARDEYLKKVGDIHVKVMKGNAKTGKMCYTISLAPVIDCQNCANCMNECYDLRNDCIYPSVIESRAINSAIHFADINRYWNEIGEAVKAYGIEELRINVGGDCTYEDFCLIAKIARENKDCDFLFFTKNYDDLNRFLDEREFPGNVKKMWSRWEGLESNNKHHVPEAHVLYADGRSTAPEYGAYYCKGDCTKCHMEGEGCWNLKDGEHVVFINH